MKALVDLSILELERDFSGVSLRWAVYSMNVSDRPTFLTMTWPFDTFDSL
jgi:hypothetical protein